MSGRQARDPALASRRRRRLPRTDQRCVATGVRAGAAGIEVLEVVQHEQQLTVGEGVLHYRADQSATTLAQTERFGDGQEHGPWIINALRMCTLPPNTSSACARMRVPAWAVVNLRMLRR
jgi:hypothetical protein